MSIFPQGQPYTFGGEQTTGTMPIAGSYMDQMRTLLTSIPSDISKDDRMLYGLLGAQSIGADIASRRSEAMFDKALAYQREASEKANEMGIKNAIIGSFLKDVPAAIGRFSVAGNEFLPAKISAGTSSTPIPSLGSKRYYGFVG